MRIDAPMPPLDGVTVVEVGTFIAAPFATMQLADLGARVIKVEDPDRGDTVRSVGPFLAGESSTFVRLNRNKEAISLDLKQNAAKSAFQKLIAEADVLVENLRPGAMRSLGLGPDDLSAQNPRLIYVSASGWGQDGPLAHLAGLDVMAQARSGLMSITGTAKDAPVKIGVPICDLVTALYVALAVTAALRERERSGHGQFIDISLYESAVSLALWEAGRYFATGEVGGPTGSAHQSMAPYQAVRSADGFVTIGAVTPKTWSSFCDVLGLARLETDERYADASSRFAHRSELIEAIEQVTTARSTAELTEVLEEVGVPCAPICDYKDVFADEHLAAREFFWDAPHQTLGPLRQIGSPMRFSRTPVRRGPAGPRLGQDTRAVLRWLSYPDEEIDQLIEFGAAFGPAEVQ
jgi:crotonobetainyl-CoA:carnitine CoA-transferase CaiB-like acyl-CoA transferase